MDENQKTENTFDYGSRWVAQKVYKYSNGTWTLQYHKKFVYSGWLLAAELDGETNAVTKTYTWGEDLSGSMQGAGGVGGLLSETNASGTYYTCYDGNGNIIAYIDTNGNKVASYEYDPYGNIIAKYGPKCNDFSFLFSTKYYDYATDLIYYGYRFYSPKLKRWLSRDPIGEIKYEMDTKRLEDYKIIVNPLYVFCDNNPILFYDFIGLEKLNSITVKRKNVKWLAILKQHLLGKSTSDDTYGHWWIEFDGESYGWWPKSGVGLIGTLFAVKGELNGTSSFGGSPKRDPHHGDMADEKFHPKRMTWQFWTWFGDTKLEYGTEKGKKCECVTEKDIKNCARAFARQYSGLWSYPWGQNCHSFQNSMMENCCMEK